MKIENEIKQSKFRNEYHKLAINLMFTNSWLQNFQNEIFSKYDITGNQYNILRILRGQHPNPATINLLKERMIDKMSDASRLVERLRVKGFVERHLCPSDRRRVDVVITKKGLDLLEEMDLLDGKNDSFFESLSNDEAITLNKLLDKLRG